MKIRNIILSLSVLSIAAFVPARLEDKDIVDTAVSAGSFKTLATLVTKAGLIETLKGDGPFTVLAPTDAAFKKLPKALVDKLVGDKKLLTSVLTYHVISGKVLAHDLKNGNVKTVQGENVKVSLKSGAMFNNSKVSKADIICSNGVIHVIDTVLLPPSVAKMIK